MFGPDDKDLPDMPDIHMVKRILSMFNDFEMFEPAQCLGVLEIAKHQILMQTFSEDDEDDDLLKDEL